MSSSTKKIEKIKLNFDEILEKFILALYIMKLFSVDMYRINISECSIQYFHATNFTILHNNIDLIETFFHALFKKIIILYCHHLSSFP